MSAIGPGDWVECWRPPKLQTTIAAGIHLGGLYCVEAILPPYPCGTCGEACAGLEFSGVSPNPTGFGMGWASCAFRPIYRPNTDFIEALKRPAPADLVGA